MDREFCVSPFDVPIPENQVMEERLAANTVLVFILLITGARLRGKSFGSLRRMYFYERASGVQVV